MTASASAAASTPARPPAGLAKVDEALSRSALSAPKNPELLAMVTSVVGSAAPYLKSYFTLHSFPRALLEAVVPMCQAIVDGLRPDVGALTSGKLRELVGDDEWKFGIKPCWLVYARGPDALPGASAYRVAACGEGFLARVDAFDLSEATIANVKALTNAAREYRRAHGASPK